LPPTEITQSGGKDKNFSLICRPNRKKLFIFRPRLDSDGKKMYFWTVLESGLPFFAGRLP
jgi:hypothetical protein